MISWTTDYPSIESTFGSATQFGRTGGIEITWSIATNSYRSQKWVSGILFGALRCRVIKISTRQQKEAEFLWKFTFELPRHDETTTRLAQVSLTRPRGLLSNEMSMAVINEWEWADDWLAVKPVINRSLTPDENEWASHHSPLTMMITKPRAVRDCRRGDQLMPQRLFLIYFWQRSTVVCPLFACARFVGVLKMDLWTLSGTIRCSSGPR